MADFLQTAFEHHKAGRLDEAEAIYRQLLNENPRHAEALNNLGLLLQIRGKVDKAIAAFEGALQARPLWPLPFLNLGNLYRDQGNPHVAFSIYREGIRLCGEGPRLRANLDQVAKAMG